MIESSHALFNKTDRMGDNWKLRTLRPEEQNRSNVILPPQSVRNLLDGGILLEFKDVVINAEMNLVVTWNEIVFLSITLPENGIDAPIRLHCRCGTPTFIISKLLTSPFDGYDQVQIEISQHALDAKLQSSSCSK